MFQLECLRSTSGYKSVMRRFVVIDLVPNLFPVLVNHGVGAELTKKKGVDGQGTF